MGDMVNRLDKKILEGTLKLIKQKGECDGDKWIPCKHCLLNKISYCKPSSNRGPTYHNHLNKAIELLLEMEENGELFDTLL